MTEEEVQRIIDTGVQAEVVLSNPAYQEALQSTLDGLFGQFLSTSADEGAERDGLWATGQAVLALNNTLETMKSNGRIEVENRKHGQRPHS